MIRRRLRAHGETLACWALGAVAFCALAVGATGAGQVVLATLTGFCLGGAVQLAGNCLTGGAA